MSYSFMQRHPDVVNHVKLGGPVHPRKFSSTALQRVFAPMRGFCLRRKMIPEDNFTI